jgi:hypothetical protein
LLAPLREIAIFTGMEKGFLYLLVIAVFAILAISGFGVFAAMLHNTASIEIHNCHEGKCDSYSITFENVGTTNLDTLNYYAKQLIEAVK